MHKPDKPYQINNVDIKSIKSGLKDGSIVLVDIREMDEFSAGHIPGAISMPLSQFDPKSLPMESAKKIIFSCAAGIRSQKLLMALQDAGYDFFEHYEGGFKEWASTGEPLEL